MTTAIRLLEALEKRLDALTAKTHCSKSYYLRRALEDYLLTASKLESYKKNREKDIPLEEVKKKLGL